MDVYDFRSVLNEMGFRDLEMNWDWNVLEFWDLDTECSSVETEFTLVDPSTSLDCVVWSDVYESTAVNTETHEEFSFGALAVKTGTNF